MSPILGIFASQDYVRTPPAPTRAVFGGGNTGSVSNVMDYVTIASAGNATDFGDLSQAMKDTAGCASSTRGIWYGGAAASSTLNIIEYITVASTGNTTSFGTQNNSRENRGAVASETRAVAACGYNQAEGYWTAAMEYITIATTGNGTNFGNNAYDRYGPKGVASSTRGVFAGGGSGSGPTDVIDYITIATTGNGTAFGTLQTTQMGASNISNGTRGVFMGGTNPPPGEGPEPSYILTTGYYITIATTGNSTTFGNLTQGRYWNAGASNNTIGLTAGGRISGSYVNTIDYITIATTGNATDFGDLTVSRSQVAGLAA